MSNLPLTKMELAEVSYQMYLPDAATDYIQQKIATEQQPYEYTMLQNMAKHLSKKDTFVDVGANIGNHSLYLAALSGCHVHAFEPNAHLAAAITHSVAANKLHKKVVVHQLGVGAAANTASFSHLDPQNLGAQSLQVGEGDITITALDDIELGKNIKLIKIDVEGMEFDVLQGAQQTIAKHRPILYVECQHLADFSKVAEFMAERDYVYLDTFNATPTHLFLPAEKVSLKQEFQQLSAKTVAQLYDYKQKFSEVTNKLRQANDKYRTASQEIDTIRLRLAQQTEQLSQKQAQLNEMQPLQQQLVSFEARLKEVNEKYRLNCEHIDQLKEKKQQLTEQLQEKQQLWLAANQKYKDATEQIAHLKSQLQQIKQQTDIPAAITSSQKLYAFVVSQDSKYAADVNDMTQQLAAVEDFLQGKISRQHELQLQLEQLNAEQTVAAQHHAQLVAQFQQQKDMDAQQLAALVLQLNDTNKLLGKMETELAQVQQQLQHSEQECQQQRQLHDEITQTLALYQQQQQQLVQDNAALQAQADAVQTAKAKLEQELSLAEEALQGAEQQQQQLSQQLAHLNAHCEQVKQQQHVLVAELTETKSELTQAIALRVEAQQHVQQLQKLAHEKSQALTAAIADKTAQEQQGQQLLEQYQQLQIQHSSLQQLSAQQQTDVVQTLAANQTLQQQLAKLQTSSEQQIGELQQQLALIEELSQVRQRSAVLSPEYQRLADRLHAETEKITQLHAQHTELKQQFDKNHSHLKNARKQLEQKQHLEQQMQDVSAQLEQAKQQTAKWFTQHIDDRSELDTLKALAKKQLSIELKEPLDQLPTALKTLFKALSKHQQQAAAQQNCKIACVMDEFTFGSYAPEANFLQLTPQHYQRELETFVPDLLFIESAWRGKHEVWGNKVGHKSQELVAIVEWCRQRHIPTLFWNKEDPVHFETFISTAKLFDHVFTTDIDCIHRYKAALEHDRVYLLPFAAQPTVNNPIEIYDRKDAFCFAGAYYVRYPDRTRDLDDFLQNLPHYKPVEIYDRNFGKNDPNYMFPDSYQPYIVGNLPYDQIDKAYKGYRYAINLNSIKHSQTMFARRAYELLASNTLTVSNYSRGVELMFGELVLNSDNGQQIVQQLQQLEADAVYCKKFQLHALRKVMQHHTYQDRFAYIRSKTLAADTSALLPTMVLSAYAGTLERAQRLLRHFSQQRYPHKKLLLVLSDQVQLDVVDASDVIILSSEQVKSLSFKQLFPQGTWFGFMVADDYYGPNYLTDLALATRYSPSAMIGKVAHYRYVSTSEIRLNHAHKAYRMCQGMEARSGIFRTDLYPTQKMYDWLRKAYQLELTQPSVLSIDSFNYCKALPLDVADSAVQALVDDHIKQRAGMDFTQLQASAEQIKPTATTALDLPALSAVDLKRLFAEKAKKGKVALEFHSNYIDVISPLADGKHEYLYAAEHLALSKLCPAGASHFDFFLEATTGMNLQLLVVFLDADNAKISHEIRYANKNSSLAIPDGCQFVQLALRFYASGVCSIKRLVLQQVEIEPQLVLPQSPYLLLTNHYPSYQDLYRNGFVHTRVKAYQEHGVAVDVFRLRKDEPVSWHEYQGVQVCTASQQTLRKMLTTGQYQHVLVHFLDPEMWDVLKDFIDQIRVTVWVHGAEVQPWWRREYNYNDGTSLEKAKEESALRQSFWLSVLQPLPQNLHLVFVSKYFADEVLEDLNLSLPDNSLSIIHNPIDTDLFDYIRKEPEQRFNWLSIRPFASAKYANDLTVSAICKLSSEPWFEKLNIRIIGDGALFDVITEPLKEFPNVVLERGFKTQPEIAALHKNYGIFFSPTRMDAQGVSRDEAMSSGLVAVTNAVTAIPEFTDDNCAILAPADDYLTMVDLLKKIINEPELFCEMSENAAQRVRSQSHKKLIINKEVNVINNIPTEKSI